MTMSTFTFSHKGFSFSTASPLLKTDRRQGELLSKQMNYVQYVYYSDNNIKEI